MNCQLSISASEHVLGQALYKHPLPEHVYDDVYMKYWEMSNSYVEMTYWSRDSIVATLLVELHKAGVF